ncbi:mucin-5B-like [Cherax quadricarinatus]|uniref:mucin-5B-like n=1 Tax=Cherax quadricarinatus TaxID=27406 RepID=UPI002378E907|nr:uncharacterized protein LOC128684571 [Cherax quadricarinatus]
MYAHVQNIAEPGSFNSTINELFKLNNIPGFTFPASPPSNEIIKSTANVANITAATPLPQASLDTEMDQSETTETPATPTNESLPPPTSTASATDQSETLPSPVQPPAKKAKTQETSDASHGATDTAIAQVQVLKGVYFYTTNQNRMQSSEINQRLQDGTVKYTNDQIATYTTADLNGLLTGKPPSLVEVVYTSKKKFRMLQNGSREDGTLL